MKGEKKMKFKRKKKKVFIICKSTGGGEAAERLKRRISKFLINPQLLNL